jgi:hypothetical protein
VALAIVALAASPLQPRSKLGADSTDVLGLAVYRA